MPEQLRGARAGGMTHDVTWELMLHVELAGLGGPPIMGVMYDRVKRFDRMLFDLGYKLSRRFGAPERVAEPMLRLGGGLQRFLTLGQF
eukprot:15473134-Heterocapsa_arctica.AAC.1